MTEEEKEAAIALPVSTQADNDARSTKASVNGESRRGSSSDASDILTNNQNQTVFPTTLSDLTHHLHLDGSSFHTTTNRSIYKTLTCLRKSTLSIPNRLKSVLQDADFIEALYHHLSTNTHLTLNQNTNDIQRDQCCSSENQKSSTWPIIPNERSGSWPLSPTLKVLSQTPYLSSPPDRSPPLVSAYLKSTDGHISQWSFSLRRLNLSVLYLLGVAGSHGAGCVLIDTTRRGKSHPDALRRTVAIWAAVWNRVLFPELVSDGVIERVCGFQALDLDESEVSQIEVRIPRFVNDLKGLGLDLAGIRQKVARPIRLVWTNQPSTKDEWPESFKSLTDRIRTEQSKHQHPTNILTCVSASKRVIGAEMSEDGYIQGAGDDSEGWSRGLTAKVFWENEAVLMRAVEEGVDIERTVDAVVAEDRDKMGDITRVAVCIKPTGCVFVAAGSGNRIEVEEDFDLVIDAHATISQMRDGTGMLGLGCREGKLGSKMLREKLSMVKAAAELLLQKHPNASILARCATGKDLSVGIALVIICTFFDEQGKLDLPTNRHSDKQCVRQRLAWITSSKPDANPSRATLQAVNSFLMDRPD